MFLSLSNFLSNMVCGIIHHGYVILDVGKVNIPAQELLDRLDLNDVCLGQKLKERVGSYQNSIGCYCP